jgi:hypothetical protein
MILTLASAVAQTAANPSAPAPIPQMTPEELPAQAPRVSYRDGQLNIDAENASLADVLTAIANETGAELDKPANSDNERVAVHLSGSPQRVIAELLDGGKYGYIILSPSDNPAGIQKLIVTRETQSESRPGATAQPASHRAAAMSREEPGPTPEYQRAERDPDAAVSATPQPEPPEPQRPATLSEAPAHPVFSGSDAQRSADPTQNPGPALLQQCKPPMEVLQDLYRIRQQQQQQQNQTQKDQAQKPQQE